MTYVKHIFISVNRVDLERILKYINFKQCSVPQRENHVFLHLNPYFLYNKVCKGLATKPRLLGLV